MDDLIERLRAATEGSAELDLAIFNAVSRRGPGWHFLDKRCETIIRSDYGRGAAGNPVCSLDRVTRSLDAAVTLVPPDCFYMVGTEFELPGYARLWRPPVTVDDRPQRWGADAATPALALCIAALMARKATL